MEGEGKTEEKRKTRNGGRKKADKREKFEEKKIKRKRTKFMGI